MSPFPLLALELGALGTGNARRPDEPHGVVVPGRDLAGEEIELVGIDLDGRIVEGAHGKDLAEILIEPVLQDRRVVSGDVGELRLARRSSHTETANQAETATITPKAGCANDGPEMAGRRPPPVDRRELRHARIGLLTAPTVATGSVRSAKKLGPEATTKGRRFSSNPAKCP